MKRRNFILKSIFSLFTYKALAHSVSRIKSIDKQNVNILNSNDTYVTLKSGTTYNLPKNPSEISSIIHFQVRKTKWSKSPIISAGREVCNEKKSLMIVDKEVNLDRSNRFTLQYINKDMGWILLS